MVTTKPKQKVTEIVNESTQITRNCSSVFELCHGCLIETMNTHINKWELQCSIYEKLLRWINLKQHTKMSFDIIGYVGIFMHN